MPLRNEEIKVYSFYDSEGVEEEFTTLDEDIAIERRNTYNLTVIVRLYEYKESYPLPYYYTDEEIKDAENERYHHFHEPHEGD